MAEKTAQVPWQFLLGAIIGISITAYATVSAWAALEGTSARMTAVVALAVVVLPVVTVVTSIGLFMLTAFRGGDKSAK